MAQRESMTTRESEVIEALLAYESEMGERVRSFDWSASVLGAPSSWSQSLQLAVGICLNSKFPMFVRWGPEFVQIYNDAYIPILGQKHPVALGRPAREVWPELWPQLEPLHNAVMHDGQATWNERTLLKMERNGFVEDTWITWSYSPIPDGNGGVGGVFCACTEETPRVRAETERDSLAEQRSLALSSAQLGWWHLDLESRELKGDERFRTIFGIDREKSSFEEVIGLVHPDDIMHVSTTVWEAMQPHNAHAFAFEARVVQPGGSVRWVTFQGEFNSSVLLHVPGEPTDGPPTGFVGTAADITERKEAEFALRASEEQKGAILASALDGIISMNAEGCITEFNPAAECMFGYLRPQALCLSLNDLIVLPEHRGRDTTALEDFLETEYGPYLNQRVEAKALRADGSSFPVEVAITRVALEGPPTFSGYVRDITERKQSEEERATLLLKEQQARQQAESANRIKDEFLATLSHELRTPLQAILGWAQLMDTGHLSAEDTQRAIEIIERSARSQVQLVEDLLDVSRIITGKLRLEVQAVDLGEVIRAAVESVSPAAQAKEIRLRMLLDPDAAAVSGDANRLQQIAWNLLTNAVKFTPKGGRVLVSLERVHSHIEMTVNDSGQGIAADFLPHIFDRFRQADQTSTRGHGGLGLGLSIVNHLVELHGGTIQVQSPGVGLGSTFVVQLPQMVTRPTSSEGEPQERRHPKAGGLADAEAFDCPPQLGHLLVLLVDDEDDARSLLQVILERCNARVVTASSVDEAFQAFQTAKPDILISDIGMPGQDGYALIKKVRAWEAEHGGRVPAVALTAYARVEDRVRALRAGFQVHVPKPVEAFELLAVVASLSEQGAPVPEGHE
jgi:PAS domain S-box-containing protein